MSAGPTDPPALNRVFIGYDPRQALSYAIAHHSLVTRSSRPLQVTPLVIGQLPLRRTGLTSFSFSRFLVPWLCGYRGWGLFVDSDVLVLDDVQELFALADPRYAVMVVKNARRFEWTSVMLFNCERCRDLTPDLVETYDRLDDFEWAGGSDLVGELPRRWNHLVGYDRGSNEASLVHFTQGVPRFEQVEDCEFSAEWERACEEATHLASWETILGASVHAVSADGVRTSRLRARRQAERRLADARHRLGARSLLDGDLARAERFLRQAVRLEPRHAGAHTALGVLQLRKHALDDAERSFRAAIESDPGQAEPRWRLGDLLRQTGRLAEAEARLSEAIALDPRGAPALIRLGRVFLLQNRTGLALECLARAHEISPDDPDLHIGLARAHLARGQRTDAIRCLERAVELDPGSAEANHELGVVAREDGELGIAGERFRRALAGDPDHWAARTNLAMLSGEDALSEAADWFGRCTQAKAQDASLHHDRAYCLFMLGRLEEAWEEYEFRWQYGQHAARELQLPQPRWDGSDLSGRTLLVRGEQGIGDEIMFASLLSDAKRTDTRILVECARRLVPLFERSFPGIEFHPHGSVSGKGSGPVHIDRQIAAGSLPRLFRRRPEDFPGRPYLIPDPAMAAELRAGYVRSADDLVVGISWRGGATKTVSDQRSIALPQWLPILSIEGVRFVCLQYGRVLNTLERLRAESGLTLFHDGSVDPLRDLDRFAAQVSACDLVISVDNSTVHLAGALGRPVWAFVPFFPDWRWGREGESSHWYSSVRLIRQICPGRWDDAIARAADDLRRLKSEG